MSLLQQNVLKSYMHADQCALAQVQARLRDVDRLRQDALAALAAAQATVDILTAQQLQLQEQEDRAVQSAVHSRSTFIGSILATFPDDCLRCIFDQVANTSDEYWSQLGHGSCNMQRLASPFTLAVVCRKWRRVALHTPCLWSYITTTRRTTPGDIPETDLERIEYLLSRSATSSLHILLRWTNATYHEKSYMKQVLLALVEFSDRWERVEIWMPVGADTCLLGALKGPTPLLAELSVCAPMSDEWLTKPRDGYLPYAPRLERLQLFSTGMSCSPRHTGLASLTTLEIWLEDDFSTIHNMLRVGAASLQHLILETELELEAYTSLQITLPRLRTLTLTTSAVHFLASTVGTVTATAPFLSAPCLTHIELNCDSDFDVALPAQGLLRDYSSTVTHLTLAGTVDAGHLTHLAHLRNVSHLVIASLQFGTWASAVADSFFGKLAITTPAIWPKLTSIVLRPCQPLQDEDGILRLIEARRTASEAASGAPDDDDVPCKLTEIIVEYNGAPAWLRAECKRLLNS